MRQANHGEDVKEYWWYLDAVPSHAWNRWRYHYPQAVFPYDDLIATNGRRGKFDPEYELLDTGVFDDDRYWIVEVDYVKADPTDLIMVIRATNAGPDADTLHVLPTAWFRNTWSWDVDAPKPRLGAGPDGVVSIAHPFLGELELLGGVSSDGDVPPLLFCENETNAPRLFGAPPATPFPKDGINDHVIHGAADRQPRPGGDEGGVLVPAHRRRQARPRRYGSACARRAPSRRRPTRSARTSTASSPRAAARPTSSTPR